MVLPETAGQQRLIITNKTGNIGIGLCTIYNLPPYLPEAEFHGTESDNL